MPRRTSLCGTRRRLIRIAFVSCGVFTTGYLANSMRTRDVDTPAVRSSAVVSVITSDSALMFIPSLPRDDTALLFFCGAGLNASA